MNKIQNEKESNNCAVAEEATIVTYGVVVRLRLESIPVVKELMKALPDVRIVFQKASAGFLRIVEEPYVREATTSPEGEDGGN